MTIARWPRSRRNFWRLLLLAGAALALVMYLRSLREEEPAEDLMTSLATDKRIWMERTIAEYERKMVPGLGQDGEPAYLEGKEKALGEAALKTVALNTVLCDRVPLNRSLKDPRNKG